MWSHILILDLYSYVGKVEVNEGKKQKQKPIGFCSLTRQQGMLKSRGVEVGRCKGCGRGNWHTLAVLRMVQDMGESILLLIHSVQGDAGRITKEGIVSVRELEACNLF